MQKHFRAALAVASWLSGLAGTALAGPQPVVTTPPNTPTLPVLLYEIDYANSNIFRSATDVTSVDTIMSIGMSAKDAATQCNLQVAWFDWDGTPMGVSGPFPITIGMTLEYTTRDLKAFGQPYTPYTENIFRDTDGNAPFEGYAQIRTDPNCPAATKLRIDAELVTLTQSAGGGPAPIKYKPINVTNPRGANGY